MANKLSPELLEKLKENHLDLSEKDMQSLNNILPESASELTFEQLNAVVGGELSTLKKVGIAAAIAAAVVAADVGQAYYRNGKKAKGMSDKSLLVAGAKEAGSIAHDIAHNSRVNFVVDVNDAVKSTFGK